jgi:hypothetical protein
VKHPETARHPRELRSTAAQVSGTISRVVDGETPSVSGPALGGERPITDFDLGFLIGILAGEGHFGGDGRQPEVTLRMHTRHERLFRWLESRFPGGRLYGPYHHGGRHYYQWMARGRYLRDNLAPLIAGRLEELDSYAAERFKKMCRDYGIGLPEIP